MPNYEDFAAELAAEVLEKTRVFTEKQELSEKVKNMFFKNIISSIEDTLKKHS